MCSCKNANISVMRPKFPAAFFICHLDCLSAWPIKFKLRNFAFNSLNNPVERRAVYEQCLMSKHLLRGDFFGWQKRISINKNQKQIICCSWFDQVLCNILLNLKNSNVRSVIYLRFNLKLGLEIAVMLDSSLRKRVENRKNLVGF